MEKVVVPNAQMFLKLLMDSDKFYFSIPEIKLVEYTIIEGFLPLTE